ncbi:S41 family peptidase [Paenibacillus oryzisoli]|uniref:S41 family peptidase n=1 Tax=Paenibacillus oryzisoli TaxID=1850517 RepID=UPI003D2B6638
MKKKAIKALKVSLAFGALLAAMPVNAMAAEDLATQQVREIIGKLHVSGVTMEDLAGKSIDQMIEGLNDPYTVFFSGDQYGQFTNSLENNYVGMGARIGLDDKGVYIDEVFPGSAAEAAGLQRDDYVRAIDGVPASITSIDDVRNKVIGEAGTKVKLTVLRGDKELTFEITRKGINAPEVTSASLAGGVGYMAISDFSSDADEDFDTQLKALQAKGLKSLIIDVRNNPGGLVDTAQNIAKHFVKDGVLIHTRDRFGNDDPVPITGGSELSIPVYILANENSASASEVLSGALQDYNKAKVIGVQTFGKGSVQQLFELDNNNALKVTIEEYLTPNMRKVNKVGITPDVKVEGSAAQLIMALQKSGINDITVGLTKHRVTFNGAELSGGTFGNFREKDHLFANTRGLAALVGAGITWNDAKRTVDLTDGKSTFSIPVADDQLVIEDGNSYVNVDLFKNYFPGLQVTEQGDNVTLQAVKGN